VLRSDQVDIVDIPDVLELDIPFGKLFGSKILTVPLVCNIVVLAEYATKITS
jgi:hypothetical protein